MKITVLVPTYRRGDDLVRCLAALKEQLRPPEEIVVVHRADDEITRAVLAGPAAEGLPLRLVIVEVPGQVAALNKGVAGSSGDIVCITDDDAAPRPDWVARIAEHFASDERIGGVGGRDRVHEHGTVVEGEAATVGRVQFFGRHIGNHHIGAGAPRDVDILKGANMSYRRAALLDAGFDTRLLGAGAQVANDMKVALSLRRRGWRLIYDPAVIVEHYPAVRHDVDGRQMFSAEATRNRAHNETLALLDFLPASRVPLFAAWALAIGTPDVPGLAQAARMLVKGAPHVGARLGAALSGRVGGTLTWLRRP
ncbi:glycosyltransferase family 2 protein [Ancylobacter lacus]|uniref:glycosyltransferase n=1 Tax=Ancylobacter lacus TaxID=2579970 RepID=UPI001BCCA48B|nr:glycosyltransferase family 2 protein [Ancylobacter lacus]MBS7538483.1 glycosyltransferase family 2 protein [Ancylobacter lacus]